MDKVLALTLMQWQSQNPKVLNHQGPIQKPLARLQLSALQFEESDLAFMFRKGKYNQSGIAPGRHKQNKLGTYMS